MLYRGIIVDNKDPLKLDRVKVRIFGVHPMDQKILADSDLQWSDPIMTTGSSKIPQKDDIVYCDFLDLDFQKSVYIGQASYRKKDKSSSVEDLYSGYTLPSARNEKDEIRRTERNLVHIVKEKARIFVGTNIEINIDGNLISFKSIAPFGDITIGGLKLLDFIAKIQCVGNLGLPAPLSVADIQKLVQAILNSTEIKFGS